VATVRLQEEVGAAEQKRRDHKVVLRERQLQDDDRQRQEQERSERRLVPLQARAPGETEDRNRAREPGEELHEADRQLVPRQAEREREADLRVRRVEIHPFVVGRLDVADVVRLQPEPDAGKVVVQRIPTVRWRRDDQCEGVGERECRRDGEHDQRPRSFERSDARKCKRAPPDENPDADDREEDLDEARYERGSGQVVNRRQEERESDDLGECDRLGRQNEIGKRPHAKRRRDERSGRREEEQADDSEQRSRHGAGV
jgi:hypothetical protein